MKLRPAFLIPAIAIIALSCWCAGCIFNDTNAGQGTTPVPSPVETVPEASPSPSPTAVSLAPGPTQTLPADYYVAVDVQKQGQAGIPTVTVIFRGGMGLAFTTQINVTVTRSDGQIVTKFMDHPAVGDEVDIAGTQYDDRVEVTDIVSTGTAYKIYDQLLPYQSVN